MPFFDREGLAFHFRETGEGIPFVFQHGLGGDVGQPFGLYVPPRGFRLIAFDCRGHGETRPLGDPARLGFDTFADDLLALLNHLGLERVIVGGISMGAGVALNFAVRYPERAMGLVLSRPAWLDRPLPENAKIYLQIAALIKNHGAKVGLNHFIKSSDYLRIKELSADAANSLVKQFEHPRAEETVEKLERLARDVPSARKADWSRIRIPALVLANRQDPIHPFEYGESLAKAIPGASLHELTPKSVSVELHGADSQRFIDAFLRRHFSNTPSSIC